MHYRHSNLYFKIFLLFQKITMTYELITIYWIKGAPMFLQLDIVCKLVPKLLNRYWSYGKVLFWSSLKQPVEGFDLCSYPLKMKAATISHSQVYEIVMVVSDYVNQSWALRGRKNKLTRSRITVGRGKFHWKHCSGATQQGRLQPARQKEFIMWCSRKASTTTILSSMPSRSAWEVNVASRLHMNRCTGFKA